MLDRMLSAGDISQEEHDAAQAEPLGLNLAPEVPEDGIYAYPYFTSYVRSLLMEENNPYGCSYADLFEGGLTIYTTLDTTLQDKAEAACDAQRARMSSELDTALVAIDPKTGQVKAMVGGGDYKSSQVNIATVRADRAVRQARRSRHSHLPPPLRKASRRKPASTAPHR